MESLFPPEHTTPLRPVVWDDQRMLERCDALSQLDLIGPERACVDRVRQDIKGRKSWETMSVSTEDVTHLRSMWQLRSSELIARGLA